MQRSGQTLACTLPVKRSCVYLNMSVGLGDTQCNALAVQRALGGWMCRLALICAERDVAALN